MGVCLPILCIDTVNGPQYPIDAKGAEGMVATDVTIRMDDLWLDET